MSLPLGLDFRDTVGCTGVAGTFAGDPTNCFFMDLRTTSGTVGGIPFSWDQSATNNSRDRANSPTDPRCAGMVFVSSGGLATTLTLTLPSAGQYDITLALGDHDNQQEISFDILDGGSGSTVLFNVATNVLTGGANHYLDATGVDRTSDSDWAANNVAKRLTFSGTSASFRLNVPVANTCTLAHLFVAAVAGGITAGETWLASQQGGSTVPQFQKVDVVSY